MLIVVVVNNPAKWYKNITQKLIFRFKKVNVSMGSCVLATLICTYKNKQEFLINKTFNYDYRFYLILQAVMQNFNI